VAQQLHAFAGQLERAAERERAYGVGRQRDGDEGEKGIVDESARVDGDLVKAEPEATAVAISVWRPRKGEKAMRTPIEKASAVRSGGSSSESRRRKRLRSMKK
jgi:hypothetical protein